MASGYASVFFILARNFRLRILANLGRMSLSNYILQAVIVVPVSLMLNLFDHITPIIALIMIAGIWILQVLFSDWWLKHYSFGPMEWVLRRFTYGRSITRREEDHQTDLVPAAVGIE